MLLPHIDEEWITYDVLYMWVIPALVANRYNIPLAWNAPGVPLAFSEIDNDIVQFLCDAVDYISVRDALAKEVLTTAVDDSRVKVVPDSVLTIPRFFAKDDLTRQLYQEPALIDESL